MATTRGLHGTDDVTETPVRASTHNMHRADGIKNTVILKTNVARVWGLATIRKYQRRTEETARL